MKPRANAKLNKGTALIIRCAARFIPRLEALAGCFISLVWLGCAVAFSFPLIGCQQHPDTHRIIAYMRTDEDYLALPSGPKRVDALWLEARDITGADGEALELLGSLATSEGARLQHPFNTGLTETGLLSPNDKAGHFFAHAWWTWQDQDRLIPTADSTAYVWEVLGEMKSWVAPGDGFDYRDLWANRLGHEFAMLLIARQEDPNLNPLPSHVIEKAEQYRPEELEPDSAPATQREGKPKKN